MAYASIVASFKEPGSRSQRSALLQSLLSAMSGYNSLTVATAAEALNVRTLITIVPFCCAVVYRAI